METETMKVIAIAFLSFSLGYILSNIQSNLAVKFNKLVIITIKKIKYHIHHNILGLLIMLIGIFYWFYIIFPFGLGIYIQHYIKEKKLFFIEKIK